MGAAQYGSAPVIAQLIGDNQATIVGGLSVSSPTPIFALCRQLVAQGADPDQLLQAYRGDTLCVSVRIGDGARLTVASDQLGRPRFRPYRGPDDPDTGPSHPNEPTRLLHTSPAGPKGVEA